MAKEKVLFYPTPMAVMALIASNLTPATRGACLDPCAGTGEPLAYLGRQLNLTTYGCELHPERYEAAAQHLSVCLNGAREYLDVEGQFSLLFSNPPYDQSLSGERMEVEHIRLDLELLLPGGVGVWVLPLPIFDFDLCHLLVRELRQVSIRRFPPPEYDRFKQVVVFGQKRSEPATYTHGQALDLQKTIEAGLPELVASELAYALPETGMTIERFELQFLETQQVLSEVREYGLEQGEQFAVLTIGNGAGIDHFQPILRLTSGHAAMAIAAGIVNGAEVEIDGEPYLIKGSTSKRLKVTNEVETEGEDTVQTTREREQLVQQITAFNLKNGRFAAYNSLDDKEGFADFLLSHQQTLVDMIEAQYPPLFEPERDMNHWLEPLARIQAPGKLPGQETASGLLPAQQVRAAALATRLKDHKSVVLIGECGTGKTCTAQAIIALIGGQNAKTVIACPTPIAAKWAREAKTVLADYGVQVHLIGEKRKQPDGNGKTGKVSKPILDTMRAMAEPGRSILVISYEMLKNGPRWDHAPATRLKSWRYTVQVEERTAAYPYTAIVEKEVSKVARVLCCPDCDQILTDGQGVPLTTVEQLGKRKRWCSCGAALWQMIPFTYGGRFAVADLLNRRYSGRYNLVMDECHNTKGGDTDIGQASQDLISGAKKVIAMTGTFYNGKASGAFYLLYRLLYEFRQIYAHTDVQRFVAHHGLIETITKVKNSNRYHSSYGYARENQRIKELPGVSPQMVAKILNHSAFLKLVDIGFVLPPYTEERLPVPLDDRLEEGIEALATLYQEAVSLARQGNPGLLSAWLYASLGWLDCPVTEQLVGKDRDGLILASHTIDGVLPSNDTLLDEPLAKDEVLLDLIESELAQERGVGVFFAQVNRRDWMGRIQKLLERRGIYAEILRQDTCKPQDREAWYRQCVQRCRRRGQKPVLLMNGNLVKEGLDLLELPTLIETGVEYKINDLRQRDRRSWRLGQTEPVRVIFLYYEETMQETALQLVAQKLKAALMVEGNLAEGLAAMEVDDGNLMDALMQAVANGKNRTIEWSGMEIAAVEKVIPSPQMPLTEALAPPPTIALEIVAVDLGGVTQLSWADLMEKSVTPAKKSKPKRASQQPEIQFALVGEQYSFL
jgi:hypothetical protein